MTTQTYPLGSLWLEKTTSYGHYHLCIMAEDGTISTKTFADSHTWDVYSRFDDDQAEEAHAFIMEHLSHLL